jgi:cell division inhibitor SulA
MRHTAGTSEFFQSPQTPAGGITEIVLPNSRSSSVYLPSLAFLSSQDNGRWLTWLAPQSMSKVELQNYGFDLGRTRFIYPKTQEHCFWLIWEALAEGNSHTVVGSPGRLTERQLNRLENAAKVGGCNGLLLRDREQS